MDIIIVKMIILLMIVLFVIYIDEIMHLVICLKIKLNTRN